MYSFDLIILGGGLVGLTAANLCAKLGISIAIVEREQVNLQAHTYPIDPRYSAISKASQNIFEKIGVWEEIKRAPMSSYQRMVVWDALGFGELIFDAAEVAESELGHIIDNQSMLQALWKETFNNNIQLFTGVSPISFQKNNEQAILELEDGTKLQAKLIVGADGGHSWLRTVNSINVAEYDYQQQALIATVTSELPHQATAWQRFLPEGPLAFLPLSSPHKSSIVWTTGIKKARILLQLAEQEFCEELAHHFDYRLGKIISMVGLKSFPLKRQQAQHYIAERVVLLGDAAHVIHPLAGQGANLGFYDAAKLAEVIAIAVKNNIDIGNYLILRRYERSQKSQAEMLIQFTEFLNKLFSSKAFCTLNIRSLGLNLINDTKTIKKKLIYRAMGI